jgi:hypothetical protein
MSRRGLQLSTRDPAISAKMVHVMAQDYEASEIALVSDWIGADDSVLEAGAGSDQDWIGERCPNEATFPAAWFERLKTHTAPPFDPCLRVLLAIKLKMRRRRRYCRGCATIGYDRRSGSQGRGAEPDQAADVDREHAQP